MDRRLRLAALIAAPLVAGAVLAMWVARDDARTWYLRSTTDAEIAPCLLARRVEAAGDGTGRLVLQLPGGNTVEGSFVAVDDDDWTITVDTVDAVVGSTEIGDDHVSGRLRSVGGTITSTIDIELRDHPEVVPGWSQRAHLRLPYDSATCPAASPRPPTAIVPNAFVPNAFVRVPLRQPRATDLTGQGLLGSVDIVIDDEHGHIELTGELQADGSYELSVVGTVIFAGHDIAIDGTYTAARDGDTWEIDGLLDGVDLGKVMITDGVISLRPGTPGFFGSVTIVADDLAVDLTLDYDDADDWTLTALGSDGAWSPSRLPDMSLEVADVDGTLTSTAGVLDWELSLDASTDLFGATLDVTAEIDDLTDFTLTAVGAAGTVTAPSGELVVLGASGTVDVTPTGSTGSIDLAIEGDDLLGLDAGWDTVADLALSWGGGERNLGLTITTTNGPDTIDLTGDWHPTSYELTAGGTLTLREAIGTVTGDYASDPSGTTWNLTAAVTDAKVANHLRMQSATITATSDRPGFVGDARLRIGGGSLDVDVDWTDSDDWSLDAATSGTIWSPSGVSGLNVRPSSLSGGISSTAGKVTWSLAADDISFGLTDGVDLVSDISISNRCTTSPSCPTTGGVYIGLTGTTVDIDDSGVPTVSASGALAADGSWARLDATTSRVGFAGISVTEPTLTIWKGGRSDIPVDGLSMPDVSSYTDGYGIEFCGGFRVPIPALTTVTTDGCIQWTPDGIVMGQVATSAAVDSGTTNGLQLGPTSVNGWGLNTIRGVSPVMSLDGVRVALPTDVNTITGTITAPGNLMEAISGDDTPSEITATGWYGDGDFEFSGEIQVGGPDGITAQGVTLQALTVDIGRQGTDFSFDIGAQGLIELSGTRFPITADVGVEVGSTTKVYVSVGATGVATELSSGSFDAATLLPSGDFEPDEDSSVPGDFDSGLPPQLIIDGGFENGISDPSQLVNGDFETGVGDNPIVGADFEDGDWLNVIDNSGFEDGVNRLPEGDFEVTELLSNWAKTSNSYTFTLAPDADDSLDDPGVSALEIRSLNSSTPTTAGNGVYFASLGGSQTSAERYRITLTARTPDGPGTFAVRFRQWSNCNDINVDTTRTTTGTDWVTVTYEAGIRGCDKTALFITPPANGRVRIDNVSVVPVTGSPSVVGNQSDPPNAESSFAPAPWGHNLGHRTSIAHGLTPFGDAYFDAKKNDSNARFEFTLDGPPCPNGDCGAHGKAYTFSIWLRSRNGSISGDMRIWAPAANGAPDQVEIIPWTATNVWTRYQVSMTIGDPRYTDLHGQVYVHSGGYVSFDEPMLQEVPWMPYRPGTDAAIIASNGDPSARSAWNKAHTAADGDSFMIVGDGTGNTLVKQTLDVAPVIGATYTFSADVMALGSTTQGALQVVTRNAAGGPDVQDIKHYFNLSASQGWTHQSMSITITSPADYIELRIGGNTGSSAVQWYAVDDVAFTGAPLVVVPEADGTQWSTADGHISTRIYDDPGGAHSGSGSLVLRSTASGSTAQRASGITPTRGSVHRLSGWIRSTTTATIELLATSSSTSQRASVTAGGGGQWKQFSVDLEATAPNLGPFSVLVTPTALNTDVRLDDLEITQVGLVPADPWETSAGSGGQVQTIVSADGGARTGDGRLLISTYGTGGQATLDIPLDDGSSDPLTVGMWVKAVSSGTVRGGVQLFDAVTNGQGVEFVADDTWQFVQATMSPLAGSTSVQLVIDIADPNVTLAVDDLSVSRLSGWTPTDERVAATVVTGDDAHDGPGHLRLSSANLGNGITAVSDESPIASADYTAGAWVRSPDGTPVTGRLVITPTGSGSPVTTRFTVGADWTWVSAVLPAPTTTPTGLSVSVSIDSGNGMDPVALDVDTITLDGTVFAMSDAWGYVAETGGSLIALTRRDADVAHSGEGYLDMAVSGGAHAYKSMPTTVTPGDVYTATAWIKGVGAATTGTVELQTLGGTTEAVTVPFTSTGEWQQITMKLSIALSDHTALRVYVHSESGRILVDDVVVQPAEWSPFGTTTTEQRNDTTLAQSGTGYLRMVAPATIGSTGAGAFLDADFSMDIEPSKVLTVYVRAPDGETVDGRVSLTLSGGSGTDVGVTAFTATDRWTAVEVETTITADDHTTITSTVYIDDAGGEIWLDSIALRPGPLDDDPDANATLDHPDTGYEYLWDDAFGIPGAHLWMVQAEVSVTDGSPALGVAATVYLDPSKMSALTGTDWVRGDLLANISYTEPCFAFGFEGSADSDGNVLSGVSIHDGTFTATEFQVALAPRGCSVGDVSLPIGASLSFDARLGSATFTMDMAIGVDSDGLPYFSYDSALDDLVIAGTTYDDVRLSTYQSATESSSHLSGTFTLPIGRAAIDFDLSASAVGVKMDGSVDLTDWSLGSDEFSVEELSFAWSIDAPIGDACATTAEADSSGNLTMGGNSLDFAGAIQFECGLLKVFHVEVEVQRSSGGQYRLFLDYDDETHVFSGELDWSFKRKNTFKVAGVKYSRRASIRIEMSLWVDFDKPSSAVFTFDGRISVSSGGGEVDCTLKSSSMHCDVEFWVNFLGTHTYHGSW